MSSNPIKPPDVGIPKVRIENLREGTQVRLHGLSEAALNGSRAWFNGAAPRGRWSVNVGDRSLSVKEANLTPIFLYVFIDSNISCKLHVLRLQKALHSLKEQKLPAYKVLLSWYCDEELAGEECMPMHRELNQFLDNTVKNGFPEHGFLHFSQRNALTRFEHFKFLADLNLVCNDGWVVFQGADDLSCETRLAYYYHAIAAQGGDDRFIAVNSAVLACPQKVEDYSIYETTDQVRNAIRDGSVLVRSLFAQVNVMTLEDLQGLGATQQDMSAEQRKKFQTSMQKHGCDTEYVNVCVKVFAFREFFEYSSLGTLQSAFCDQSFFYFIRHFSPDLVYLSGSLAPPDTENDWMYFYRWPGYGHKETVEKEASNFLEHKEEHLKRIREPGKVLEEDRKLFEQSRQLVVFRHMTDDELLLWCCVFRSNVELYVTISFWVIKNPRKELMILQMRDSLKRSGSKNMLWEEYVALQYPPHRCWLIDHVDEVLLCVCQRVGLLPKSYEWPKAQSTLLNPGSSLEKQALFRDVANICRNKFTRLHSLPGFDWSKLSKASESEEVANMMKSTMATGQAVAIARRVGGFCGVAMPELEPGSRDDRIDKSMGLNTGLLQLVARHMKDVPGDVPGELVRTWMGGFVDVYSVLKELAVQTWSEFNQSLDEVYVYSTYVFMHQQPEDLFGWNVPTGARSIVETHCTLNISGCASGSPGGCTTFSLSADTNTTEETVNMRPRQEDEDASMYLCDEVMPKVQSWLDQLKDAGWNVNRPSAVMLNGQAVDLQGVEMMLYSLACDRAQISLSMTFKRKKCAAHPIQVGMLVVLKDVQAADADSTRILTRRQGHKVIAVTKSSFVIAFDSCRSAVTLSSSSSVEVLNVLIDHKGRENHCEYGSCAVRCHLKACSACNRVKYCCEEHARLDWDNHKYYCAPEFGSVKNKRMLEWAQQILDDERALRSTTGSSESATGYASKSVVKITTSTASSSSTQDYVPENRRVKPNEPCVCSSGAKFKKCCGRGGIRRT